MKRVCAFFAVATAVLLVATTVAAELSLRFANPVELALQDSIPRRAGERLVLFNDQLQADWVAVVCNVPYERARAELREIIQKAFGIEAETEIVANVLPDRRSPERPEEPLFGNGGIEFRRVGLEVSEGREFRIRTRLYNQSGSKNYSQSVWRVIDGTRLYGRPCSLLVVSRTDHSSEWAKMHPGIPLPFKVSGETRLITETETRHVRILLERSGAREGRYFVLPNHYFSTTVLFTVMRAIRDASHEVCKGD